MKRLCPLWLLFLFGGFCGQCLRAEELATPGWSQDLLDRLIATPLVSEAAADGQPLRLRDGFVLRSYQLRNLHLGDPGAGTNVVNILRRMLPAESQVTEDRSANTIHVLTDRSAQNAVIELISAMDGEGERASTSAPEGAVVPDEVKKALEALAAQKPDSQHLIKLIEESSERLENRMSDTVRQSESEARADLHRELVRFGSFGVAGLILLVGAAWTLLQRQRRKETLRRGERDRSLALLPTQGMELLTTSAREQQQRTKELQALMESFSIAYQADRQRGAVVLEAVAQKHREIGATLEEVQRWRQEMSEHAGKIFIDVNRAAIEQIIDQASRTLAHRADEVGVRAENATKKMEETADRLEVQHAKAEALANELERTQREVDSLFEKLRESQAQARQAEHEAEAQRQIAYEKAAALAKKEAALAGLSLLMQEPISEILETVNQGEMPLAETVPFPRGPVEDHLQNESRVSLESGPSAPDFMVAEPRPANDAVDPSSEIPEQTMADTTAPEQSADFVCPTRPSSYRILPIP